MSFTCPTRAGWQRLLTPDTTDITLQGLVIQTKLFRKDRPKEDPDFGICVGAEGHRTAVEHHLFHSNTGNFCHVTLCNVMLKVVQKWRKRKLLKVWLNQYPQCWVLELLMPRKWEPTFPRVLQATQHVASSASMALLSRLWKQPVFGWICLPKERIERWAFVCFPLLACLRYSVLL